MYFISDDDTGFDNQNEFIKQIFQEYINFHAFSYQIKTKIYQYTYGNFHYYFVY